jgi:hypothetical protein
MGLGLGLGLGVRGPFAFREAFASIGAVPGSIEGLAASGLSGGKAMEGTR